MSTLQVPVTDADYIEGDPDAPVTLVEYADYECPYCGAAYSVIKRVQKHFGKRLRFVFRNFPLTQIHPEAENAAKIAEFAGAHGRFWEMHDALFENQEALWAGALCLACEDVGFIGRGFGGGARASHVQAQDSQRLHGRAEERRQWHAYLLHQRQTPRCR